MCMSYEYAMTIDGSAGRDDVLSRICIREKHNNVCAVG